MRSATSAPRIERLEVLHDAPVFGAAMNMALDEALLEAATIPLLRFYRWARPAVSFGYFGAFTDVANFAPSRELVRRWTGGGIVLHGSDLTYALVIPASHPLHAQPATHIYTLVHGAICRALVEAGEEATLASDSAPKISEACFANPARADVLLGGRKIAGAAIRRTKRGLLQQGSIQQLQLPLGFAADFAARLSPAKETFSLTNAILSRAEALAREKYATPEWLHRR